MNTDYAIAVELLMGVAEYGSANTYAILKKTWGDARPIPEQNVLEDRYVEYMGEQDLKHPEYYKYQNNEWVLNPLKKQELKEVVSGIYDSKSIAVYQKDFYTGCGSIAEYSKTQTEFLTGLYNFLSIESESNKNKRADLASKSMQELMDIYDSEPG